MYVCVVDSACVRVSVGKMPRKLMVTKVSTGSLVVRDTDCAWSWAFFDAVDGDEIEGWT
jgi:hypothetical protein